MNTRDEPHADPERYRRFHVIIGDANMSPFATWLKAGVTALVLESLVLDPARRLPRLVAPLEALTSISRDATLGWSMALEGGVSETAIGIQRAYLGAVRECCDLSNPERAEVVAAWDEVLSDLEIDPVRCRDRLDWVAKRELIREFQAAQGIADSDPWLRALDLEYHLLDATDGLYFGLEQTGAMRGVPDEAAVREAVSTPPMTRAYVRGRCIRKFESAVIAAQWDHITLRGRQGPIRIPLLNLFHRGEIERWARVVDAARTPDDLIGLAAPSL